ncbi:MAG: LacI family transcriptional regulator [Chloroflexota bacterium]|nr:LacI family transcriptional regulator [Chloroflexota bacterium]
MATIRDVAHEAGVSVQTVSNVLHERSFVGPEIQSRVRAAIAQLNYHPNQAARSMRSRLNQTLGFLLSDPNPRGLADPFYGEVLAGIAEVARAQEFGLLIDLLPSDRPLQAADFLRPFQTRRIDAAIIFVHGVASAQAYLLDELAQANVLFAVLSRQIPGAMVYSVLAADYEGAFVATQHLLGKGHRRVGFIDSTQRWPAVEERWRGYRTAMQLGGLDAHITAFSSPDWTAEGGATAARRLLDLPAQQRPTALVAGSDLLAVGVIQALRAHGIRVPVDMAVCGFDDFEFARYSDPPLTTVRLPAFEMGCRAAELLLGHLHGKPAPERHHVLPTELIVRQST